MGQGGASRGMKGPLLPGVALSVGLLLGTGVVEAAETREGDDVLSLHGKSLRSVSHVFGSPGHPRPGDVLQVGGGVVLRLGKDRHLDLEWSEDRQVLQRRVPGRPPVTVAVTVKELYWNGEIEGLDDPLARLDRRQLRRLQGVRLEVWNPAVAAGLARLDLSRTCLSIDVRERTPIWPALPTGLRCLSVSGAFETRDLEHLSGLEWLEIRSHTDTALDLAPLGGLAGLRSLRIWHRGRPPANVEAVGRLRRLRRLDLSLGSGLTSLSFVEGLRALEDLDVTSSGVVDLRPLGTLPALRRVLASGNPVRWLPEGPCPALRELNVLSTTLSPGDVTAFRRSHPRAAVWRDWNETLRLVLAGADGMRVRAEHVDGRSVTQSAVHEERDRGAIERIIGWLEVDEPEERWHCGCLGDPWLEFTRDGRSVATVSFHHGLSIRWQEGEPGWPGDAALRPANAAALVDWLAARGVTGPREEIEEGRREVEREGRKTGRMTAGMSPRLREVFLEGRSGWVSFTPTDPGGTGTDADAPSEADSAEPPHPLAEALSEELPDPADQARLLLAVLGTDNGSWTRLEWQEQSAETLLGRYPRSTL